MKVRQLALAVHAWGGAVPTRRGYRPRCSCGWEPRKVYDTKRAAQGAHRSHATTEVERGV